jgi:hypothetical protein
MTDFLYALIKSIVINEFKMGIPENDIIRIKHHISGSWSFEIMPTIIIDKGKHVINIGVIA